ncbi:ATP-binding protein [Vibrio pectenicida]|uniref:histidine kinase n=1 Tax=Vibrio pectenicida TaxID=62763 RepID=A0A427U7B7_9VIBR|nr:ATP-binding protein [Vibrio pectenicida]RSD32534.1 ATP-binding protein [Vibrio pectenicida]
MPISKIRLLKRLSLKSRLVLAAVVWLTAMIIAAGIMMPSQVYLYMQEDTKQQLAIYMDEIAAALEADEKGNLKLTSPLSDPRFTRPYSGFYWSAKTSKALLRSRSLWDKTLTSKSEHDLLGARDEKLIYIDSTLYYPNYSGPIEVTIGMDQQPIEDTVRNLMGQLWFILALLYIGVLTLITIQVQWSLSPLSKMHKELSQLRSGKKTQLDQEYPKEVAPVVSDLNALVFHYQELLERARHHAGNLSHALKTPLSVLKNEVATKDAVIQEQLRPSLEQIQNQIDYHLARARMAGAKNILSVSSCPSKRVDAISRAFDKVYADRGISLINELDSDLNVAVEQTDLNEMLGNIIENAYKWSESIIRVHSLQNSENPEIIDVIIEDDGVGIPEQKMAQVIHRGVRLDETIPGTGLGLNIVSEMAHSYRGKLTLDRSSLGGLKVILSMKLVQ